MCLAARGLCRQDTQNTDASGDFNAADGAAGGKKR
jgi:hypothetical protein